MHPPKATSTPPDDALPGAPPEVATHPEAGSGTWAPLAAATSRVSFGGKGAALARLAAAGLPVPDGVALDPSLVEAIATSRPGALAHLELALGALLGAAATWGGSGGPRVAVRSSAVDEDGGGASFAGQHATVLGVSLDVAPIARAVETVWKSGRTPSALAYRERLGIAVDAAVGPGMAVVVQRLVDPEVAGVAFSRHPVTGADTIVVEGSWGLGEVVVAGLVTPDHACIARSGEIVERRVGWKDVAIRVVDGGVAEHPVPADRVEAPALGDALLASVAALVRRCEEALGGPQDVEWAYGDGALHCLQSRPITRGAGPGPHATPRA